MIQVWLLRLLPWVLLAAFCGTLYWYVSSLQDAKEKADARNAELQTSLNGHIAAQRALADAHRRLQDAYAQREAARDVDTSRHRTDTGRLKNAATAAPAGQEWAPAAVPDVVRGVLKGATSADTPAGVAPGPANGAPVAHPDAGVRSRNQPRPGAVRSGPDTGPQAGKRG